MNCLPYPVSKSTEIKNFFFDCHTQRCGDNARKPRHTSSGVMAFVYIDPKKEKNLSGKTKKEPEADASGSDIIW